MSIGKNIAHFRKKKGWTQSELGDKLGVSNQAVSKWESEMTMPDIMLLPQLADVFGCCIDELFSRTINKEKSETYYDSSAEFPWPDDTMIRCVVFKGRKILQTAEDSSGDVTFKLVGNTGEVTCMSDVVIEGNVTGGCVTKGNLCVNGNIAGECVAENIEVHEWILGECTASGNIIVGGNITGDCCADQIIYKE